MSKALSASASLHASSGSSTADAPIKKARHASVACFSAADHAGRAARSHTGRSSSSVTGVSGMIWMPNVYSGASPNHVERSTLVDHRQPTTPLSAKTFG